MVEFSRLCFAYHYINHLNMKLFVFSLHTASFSISQVHDLRNFLLSPLGINIVLNNINVKNSSISDNQMSELSQQTMVSALDGNRSQDLPLSLRLSVCEGVRIMYHSYQNKKWSKVRIVWFLYKNIFKQTVNVNDTL